MLKDGPLDELLIQGNGLILIAMDASFRKRVQGLNLRDAGTDACSKEALKHKRSTFLCRTRM